MNADKIKDCIFCVASRDGEGLLLYRDDQITILLNRFPYTTGHLMVSPVRHVAELGQLSPHEAHMLIEELMDATLDERRKKHMADLERVELLIIDDLGMRKLPPTAAEDLLEIIMRRYERASTILTSNRPIEDWGKVLGDTAAITALLDRLLHHAHVLKCGPRSWRSKEMTALQPKGATR